jgi:lysophospholipid acyltransferase (LPLAT)-like uncharacterized protein
VAYTRTQRLILAIAPRVAALLIRLLGMTLRYDDVFAPGGVRGDLIPGPVVYAFWHRSLLVCAERFRGLDIAILISRSFDGELIARTVERLGFVAIRGSSSRGGATGLRNLQLAYRAGHRCAFTADGPRGPAMILKPGPVQLAQLVEADWIGSFYALPQRAWQLNSWDRFLIPKPFSRIIMAWPPHVLTAGKDADTIQRELQAALNTAVALAERTAGI